jgi:predicted HD superfamily hydrolase involved in NAD metabolism
MMWMSRGTEHYLLFLKRMVTSQTFQHSLGVMHKMSELAEIYSLDRKRAMITGLLHDVAKDLEPERQLALAEEAKVVFCHTCERLPVYLHGPVGAYLVCKELEITDRLILDAISTHTYHGNALNSNDPLFWCLRFADVLAPTREWKGRQRLASVVGAGKMQEAVLLLSSWLIEYLQECRVPVHPSIVNNFLELAAKLGVGNGFFERW